MSTELRLAVAGGDSHELRFAVLGDSLSEGVGDPAPDGRGWRGWPELLAGALAADRPVRVVKLARSGALSTDVAYRQLPAALAERPQLASVMAGGNDTLRAGFDIHRTVAALDHTMGALAASGARLLTACLPDAGRALGLPWPSPSSRLRSSRGYPIPAPSPGAWMPSTPPSTPSPSATARCTCTSPHTPARPSAAPGASTGCTRASAAIASWPVPSMPSWYAPG
ncbi:SGNH/GDSL hydrolase family protein [Streptomyces boninensis]|uniref:SGNH/GDSL hydrolase family protein n=1 Tax=Streptomyces boninensis TaxID=2039455 RepID=UPI003B225951